MYSPFDQRVHVGPRVWKPLAGCSHERRRFRRNWPLSSLGEWGNRESKEEEEETGKEKEAGSFKRRFNLSSDPIHLAKRKGARRRMCCRRRRREMRECRRNYLMYRAPRRSLQASQAHSTSFECDAQGNYGIYSLERFNSHTGTRVPVSLVPR